MKLNQYTDNHEIAYRVTLEVNQDITAPLTKTENVTKQRVREMFQKFMLASPELWQHTREAQINEFNQQRQKARRPKIKPEILNDLEIIYPENP
jgi:very-short-patch-repair endonuclease